MNLRAGPADAIPLYQRALEVDPDYDEAHKAAQVELDPVKRAALLIKCNDLAIKNFVVIPVVARPGVAGAKDKLVAELSGWDNNTWTLADWYRDV